MFTDDCLAELEAKIMDFQSQRLSSKIAVKFDVSIKNLDSEYSTGIVLALAKLVPDKPNPMVLAQSLVDYLYTNLDNDLRNQIANIFITPPGFLNIKFSKMFWSDNLKAINSLDIAKYLILPESKREKIAIEYGDANSHKIPHIGHFSSYIRGKVIANFLRSLGHQVHEFSYQGDIGLQVAKCLWGFQEKSPIEINNIVQSNLIDKALFLQECYHAGALAYDNLKHKENIDKINNQIYLLVNDKEIDPKVTEAYLTTLRWSEDYRSYFEQQLDIEFQDHIYESEVQANALEICQNAFKKNQLLSDQGAIIYPAGKLHKDWHNRVFVTQKGNPTYEAKDLGLTAKLMQDLPDYNHYVLAGSEQTIYFAIVSDAAEKILNYPKDKFRFLSNGLVILESGKMSSRDNNIITAQDCIDQARDLAIQELHSRQIDPESIAKIADEIMRAALFYGFVKSDFSNTSVFDIKQALDFSGNSGPYLQYTVVRIRSLLAKFGSLPDFDDYVLDNLGIELLIKLSNFVQKLPSFVEDLSLHKVSLGLFELAKSYNRFYNDHNILKLEDRKLKNSYLLLTKSYGDILAYGLNLLNITIPDKM